MTTAEDLRRLLPAELKTFRAENAGGA